MRQIKIFDTTLRDGEQSPGCSMNLKEKIEVAKCLEKMKAFFEETVAKAKEDPETKITVEVIGIRPCGAEVDETIFNEMVENAKAVCEKYSGMPCALKSGSTDANIPMSLGIPSICVGNYMGGGVHTREEYLEIASVPVGLKITAEIILQYFS